MPNRILREGILDSEAVNKLTPPEEVFYRRLMSVVDDFGRFDGRASVLRSRLFSLRVDDVSEHDICLWLGACVRERLIALYEVDLKTFVLFHKLGSPRAKDSKFPPPPPELEGTLADANICAQTKTYVPGSGSGSGSGTSSGKDSSEPRKPAASEPTTTVSLLVFPCVGKDQKTWHLHQPDAAEWAKAFPGIDVLAEGRKALAWIDANPTKRKTFRGMKGFLVRWFERATNDNRGGPKGKPTVRDYDAESRRERGKQAVESLPSLTPEQMAENRRLLQSRGLAP